MLKQLTIAALLLTSISFALGAAMVPDGRGVNTAFAVVYLAAAILLFFLPRGRE